MSNTLELKTLKNRLVSALDDGNIDEVARYFKSELSTADIAHILQSCPSTQRESLWDFVEESDQGQVLSELNDDVIQFFLQRMSYEELAETTRTLPPDDVADILQQLTDDVRAQVLTLMPFKERSSIEGLLAFPENTAGGLMTTQMIVVNQSTRIKDVLRYLRKTPLPSNLDRLWVSDSDHHYCGSLALTDLLQANTATLVAECMNTELKPIGVLTPAEDVARTFERQDLVSAPVVNDDQLIIGQITIDDVVDVIRESADHNMMSMAGLDEEDDPFAPVLKSSKDRAVWLGINMATAFIAAAVMSQFEASIDKIVALAVLSPVVASMGGIAGSQTLTLMIRGIATGHIENSDFRWLCLRELGVGLLNGILWASVIGSITIIWYNDELMALIIAIAIILNICMAVLAGTALPFILSALKIDPALSGSVILTTITDVFGFVTFLSLATLFLL